MNRILSFEQYKETVASAKEKDCRLSNCFFLPAAVKEKIGAGSFFFKTINNGLLLLDDIGDFYRCYYFLSGSKLPERVSLDKDAVIEFPFNGAMNERQLFQVKQIEAMGFRLGRESGMMAATPEHLVNRCSNVATSVVLFAEKNNAQQISDLMQCSFNPLYAFLPTLQKLVAEIEQKRVLVIRDGNDIAAALISGFEKKTATIEQVAVALAYRGKGLGKVIVQSYHGKYADEAVSFQHWVDLSNTPAIKMYQNFGYTFGLRKANEYIL